MNPDLQAALETVREAMRSKEWARDFKAEDAALALIEQRLGEGEERLAFWKNEARRARMTDTPQDESQESDWVKRVYWYSDFLAGMESALRELWRAIFGCHHDWRTIRFQHLTHVGTGEWGTWAVNECRKCGAIHPFANWQGCAIDGKEEG